jgi:hypothetical protein
MMGIQFGPIENSLSVLNIVECFMFMAGEIFTIYVECDQHWSPNLGGLALTRDHTFT